MEEKRSRVCLSISGEANYRIKGHIGPPTSVLVREISRNGLRFVAAEPLQQGLVIELNIRITNIADTIYAVGKVLWQRQLTSRFLLDTCIKFTILNEESQGRLISYIYQFAECSIISREHVRCPLITDVKYQILSKNKVEKKAVSGDIAVVGMKLFVEELLDIDAKMNLIFSLPGENLDIHIKGAVVWKREESNKTLGVKFTEILDEDKQKILTYINNKLLNS